MQQSDAMISVEKLQVMLESGCNNIYNHHFEINALNVFPVPDGDTGTNLHLTSENALKVLSSQKIKNICELMNQFSRGLLIGARGNSGVIFSQIFKGFAIGTKGIVEELRVTDFIKAMKCSSQRAYKSVLKPVEGTILTAIRIVSEKLDEFFLQKPNSNYRAVFNCLESEMKKVVNNTPNMLPVLKEAGVVDSGASGLERFFEGFIEAYNGKKIKKLKKIDETKTISISNLQSSLTDEYGYCTEFIIDLGLKKILPAEKYSKLDLELFRDDLKKMGDSLVVVKDSNLLKVHIHVKEPGQVLAFGQTYGEFRSLKIENMSVQAKSHLFSKKDRNLSNNFGLISCVPSDEMKIEFCDILGVDEVVKTDKYNPSTENLLEAISRVNAKHVFILPNNSNYILAAQQAAKLERKSRVHVVPTRSVPEGLAACLHYVPTSDWNTIYRNMRRAVGRVSTGFVTISSKSTRLNGVLITKGDYIGIVNKKIVCSGKNRNRILMKVLKNLITKKIEFVNVIVNPEVTPSDLQLIEKFFIEKSNGVEYKIIEGGKSLYHFVIGAEE